MKSRWIAPALLAFASGSAAASTGSGDLAALKEAARGAHHACVAVARKAGMAYVECEFSSEPNSPPRGFLVPLAWVKEHFEAAPGGAWISTEEKADPAFPTKQEAQDLFDKRETARRAAGEMLLLVRDPVARNDGTVAVTVETPPAGASCTVVLRKSAGAGPNTPAWEMTSKVPDCDFRSKR